MTSIPSVAFSGDCFSAAGAVSLTVLSSLVSGADVVSSSDTSGAGAGAGVSSTAGAPSTGVVGLSSAMVGGGCNELVVDFFRGLV
jgi:hypothetical protein